MPLPAKNLCGARTRSGGECTQPAMSNGRCRMHGGKSPAGIGSATFTHGRFSKSIPSRLSASYEETLSDPRKLELDHELALVIARNRELLSSLYSGESDGLWRRLNAIADEVEKARDEGRQDDVALGLNELFRVIRRGAKDAERWAELMANVETQRRLAESERKRRIEDHQIATTEEVLALMGAVLAVITRHVRDDRVRRAIGMDIDALIERPEERN